jgi:hypothetical protein
MPVRRPLTFAHLNDVMPEVDRLMAGYSRSGNWSLGQVCHHLSSTIRYSIEGWPGRYSWLLRRTIGPRIGRHILCRGKMPDGIRLKGEWRMIPGEGLDDRAEAEALRAALRFYAGWPEPFPEHPIFGPLTRDQWDRLHCVHAAHHLGCLSPREPVAG